MMRRSILFCSTLFRSILLSGLFLLLSYYSIAQSYRLPGAWAGVEDDLNNKKALVSLSERVATFKEDAIRINDIPALARCIYYQYSISDKKTEDTLFFKNSLILDSLVDPSRPPSLLKSLAWILKSWRINEYKERFSLRGDKNLIAHYDPRIDYSLLDSHQLDSLTDNCLQQAAKIAPFLQTNPQQETNAALTGDDLLWFSHDASIFLFPASLQDIIFAERIRLQPGIDLRLSEASGWLSLSPQAFIKRLDDSTRNAGSMRPTFYTLYAQWIKLHIGNADGADFFIETLARKYLYSLLPEDLLHYSNPQNLYEEYLQTLLHSPFKIVKAHGVYQLCLLWNKEAEHYNPSATASREPLYRFLGKQQPPDTVFQWYFQKAANLFRENEILMSAFPLMNKVLVMMNDIIESRDLHVETDQNQLPNQKLPVFLRYRNIHRLYAKIIRINPYENIYNYNRIGLRGENYREQVLKFPSYRESSQELPLPADHQWHNIHIKIDPLPAGNYLVLFSDTAITPEADITRISSANVRFTSIAVINNDRRVFILDRKTGLPLAGVTVTGIDKRESVQVGKLTITQKDGPPHKTSPDGSVTLPEQEDITALEVIHGDDSVMEEFHEASADLPDEFYDKDVDDDLVEYYTKKTRLSVFTDRAIYRPGQTVHYKGIFIVPDPKSGEPLVLNWKNLRLPFFKKLWLRLMVKYHRKRIELQINDPFDRAADTLKVLPNEYGSFAGSFALPKNAAPGDWEFDCKDLDPDYEQRARFSVEEYKRPGFELKIEKPVGEVALGDPFTVKLRLRSFGGATLAQTAINYKIIAEGYLPAQYKDGSPTDAYIQRDLSSGTVYTDEHGEYLLPVYDSLLKSEDLSDAKTWHRSYRVEAHATDAAGESQEGELTVSLSSNSVMISISLDPVLEKKDLVPTFIQTRSEFAGALKKQVDVYLYKLLPTLPSADQLIYKTTLITGGDSAFNWPLSLLNSGRYRLEIICYEKNHTRGEKDRVRGKLTKEFSLFDKTAGTLPDNDDFFNYLRNNLVERGGKIDWISGNATQDVYSIYHATYYAKTKTGIVLKNEYATRYEKIGIHDWVYAIPMDAIDEIRLTRLCIINNELHKEEKTVTIPLQTNTPGIIIERYRRNLTPGGRETFVLSVKTKNENTAAELMTTMYDASLDKLEKHVWQIPNERRSTYPQTRWNGEINSHINADWSGRPRYFLEASPFQNALEGRVAGISITNGYGLNEVVVTALGVSKRRDMTSAAVQIRGTTSLTGYKGILVVLDGIPYTGDVTTIDPNTIVQGILLKGADAAALYGSRASNGVLILSTKGPVQLPTPEEPPVTVRRNFSETAFFYPQVHAGRNGYYTISFTLPESVTEWKWKMLAHTKKAAFAYEERTLFSRLPLMVQPNMPRYLFQGDTTTLVSRITNLDSNDAKGTLHCQIEDAVTGADLTTQLLINGQTTGPTPSQPFSAASHGTTSGGFRIAISAGLLHPLKIKITASSKNYSDGEEHILPILARKILVTRQLPVQGNAMASEANPANPTNATSNPAKPASKPILTPPLPGDAEPYGIGLFITPKPQAALINSLPYLAECPYDCSEQTFNKLLAHLLAIRVVQKDTAIQKELAALQQTSSTSAGEKQGFPDQADEPGLPDEMTMPWLQLEHMASVQRASLTKLLDTLAGRGQINHYLKLLYDRQSSDGGLPWFQGGKSSEYISNYLLAGFGKIKKEGLPLFSEKEKFISRLVDYCDQQIAYITSLPGNLNSGDFADYLYARSYWIRNYPLSDPLKHRVDSLLNIYWTKQEDTRVGQQATMISATLRYTAGTTLDLYQILRQKSLARLESIRQLAITDSVNGTRWKEMSDPDDLSTQTEEWVVRTAEAFEDAGEPVQGIVQWLLQTRQDHKWSTTKSTADVVSLLERQATHTTPQSPLSFLQLETAADSAAGNVHLRVSDGLLNGQGFAFGRVGAHFPLSVNLSAEKAGAINYYYFSADPPAEETGSAKVRISKALYRYDEASRRWDSVTALTPLKIGNKMRTVLTIDARRFLRYVFIEDKHAAALEAGNTTSGYQYDGSLEYYRSVRDWGFQFFAEKIPSGISTITYETVVYREGSFLSGLASLQCMYQPTIKAYSQNGIIRVGN